MTTQPVDKQSVPTWAQFQVSLSNHPIIRDDQGVLRYQENPLTCYLLEHVSVNDMWLLYRRKAWSREQFMQFYRDIGYSLSGFEEVWGEVLAEMESAT